MPIINCRMREYAYQLWNSVVHLYALHKGVFINAFLATFLTVFGGDITGFFRRYLRRHGFLIRYILYIVICVTVFPLLAIILKKVLYALSYTMPPAQHFVLMVALFLLVALFADRKKEI